MPSPRAICAILSGWVRSLDEDVKAHAATPDLRRYVRSRPGDPDGYRDLARCLEALGEVRAAEEQARIGAFVERSR